MNPASRSQRGYSIVELLVVMAIVSILAIAAVAMIGSRPSAAVRSTLDEVEGVVMGAQKLAMARGADVYLVADGDWNANSATFFVLGYDVMKPVDANSPTNAVNRIIQYSRNPASATSTDQLPAGSFRLMFNPTTKAVNREQMNVGIMPFGSTWYATALGTTADLRNINPGNVDPLKTALALGNDLAQGTQASGSTVNVAIVSGLNKRWIRDFHFCVVGMRSGNAVPGGPVGFVIVPANSATVYKFVNPGSKDSDGQWRRM